MSNMSYSQPSLRLPLGSKEVELERRRIENENMELTAKLKSAILANRRRLNGLAPISYLPPEVLSHIFRLLVDDEKPEYDVTDGGYFFIRRPRTETKLGWIGVTHVCGHWRRVAIEDHSLWRYPPLTLDWDPNWTKTFLSRCQCAPLSILHDRLYDAPTYDGHSNLSSAIIRSTHDHLFHIRDLHIEGTPQTLASLFSGLIKAVPLLSSATFAVSSAHEGQANHVSRIPRQLFNGSAPNLRDLSLTNCVILWDSPTLCHVVRNLTCLTIFFPRNGVLWSSEDPDTPISRQEVLPSLAQLLDVLAAAPSLDFLILNGILPSWSSQVRSTSPHDTRVVSLPHLGAYHLKGNAYDCAAVSRHINAAPRTQLGFECFFEGDGIEAELSAIAAALEDHISHYDHSPMFFSYIFLDTLGDSILIRTRSYCIKLPSRVDTIVPRVGFLRKCLALWPVSTSTSLRLHRSLLAFTKRDLIQIFDSDTLHHVDRVVLEGFNVRDFIDALREQTESADFRILPGLQDISLKSLRLDRLALLSIHDVFALRKQSGRPIRNLRMEKCSRMSRFWSEKLQSDLGVKLSCDEFTQEQSIP